MVNKVISLLSGPPILEDAFQSLLLIGRTRYRVHISYSVIYLVSSTMAFAAPKDIRCRAFPKAVRAPRARQTNQSVRLRVRKLTVDQLAPRQSAWFPVWIFHPTPIPPRTPTFTPAPAHPRPRAILFLSLPPIARRSRLSSLPVSWSSRLVSLSPLSRLLAPPDNRLEAPPAPLQSSTHPSTLASLLSVLA
ncbi:hypothetical protein Landi51_10902 [Colletotrichum acutatum]